jgi:outer membrane lipoprotein LolB
VDSLMEQALGFSLPVSGMRDWLHGRPAPGAPSNITRAADGRPDTLRQSGWTVRYVAWQDAVEGAATSSTLPRRIDMARDGNESPLSVRLVIDPENKQ